MTRAFAGHTSAQLPQLVQSNWLTWMVKRMPSGRFLPPLSAAVSNPAGAAADSSSLTR